VIAPLMVIGAALIALKAYLKWAPPLTGYDFWKWLKTIHFAELKQRFYDTTLNVNVGYAKHAISIDENRKDFARVGWKPTASKLNKRDDAGYLYFEQVWFPGVHADIGGGYEENGSPTTRSPGCWRPPVFVGCVAVALGGYVWAHGDEPEGASDANAGLWLRAAGRRGGAAAGG
jgi:Uncharacterized alpha/beta hydrolase domain (DUF2235)